MALLECINNPITLEVYGGQAEGSLYLDDGETFEYELLKRDRISISFNGTCLTTIREAMSTYTIPEG